MNSGKELFEKKANKFQKQWVEALRSGRYKKTISVLRDNNDGFCCLGVACEELGLKAILTTDSDEGIECYKYADQTAMAPKSVVNKLKLKNAEGIFYGTDKDSFRTKYLTSLNDDDNLSFEEIAKFIENNPEKVFTNFVKK